MPSLSYIKEKWGHSGFQKYLKNLGWVFSARIFVLVVAFFINAYMARYLGPANFGLLNYVFSFVGLFGFLASFGIESIASREIIKDHSKKDQIIGTSFYLKLFGSLIAILAIFISAKLSTNDPILIGMISMYSTMYIFSAFNIIDIYFQSQVLSKYSSLVTIFAGIISAILKIITISLGGGIIWLTAIYVLETTITALGAIIFFVYNKHSIKNWVFNKAVAVIILKDSWPLMLSSVAFSVYMKIDQVMIKNMLGNEQTGVYAVAAKLSEFWYFIPNAICSSLFPAIVNAKKISTELYEERLSKLYSLMIWLSIIMVLLISLFAHQIINTLFGTQYIGAVGTLRIYVWAGIFTSLGIALGQYLIVENKTKVNAITTMAGAIINVILNLILIPKYGINGAATATFISYSIITLMILFYKGNERQLVIVLKSIIPKITKHEK